jgi:hypothetical protein
VRLGRSSYRSVCLWSIAFLIRFVMTGKSDKLPRFRHLSADEILDIRAVSLNFPYNFAQPPQPKIRWSLCDLIDHSRFPMAKADACDKWGLKYFSLENFVRLIDLSQIAHPGYLSPMTVAKLVAYSLQIVESTAESMEALTGHVTYDGEQLVEQIFGLAGDNQLETSPWQQFVTSTRHPTVRWAINNAVMNRWGAEGFAPERAS